MVRAPGIELQVKAILSEGLGVAPREGLGNLQARCGKALICVDMR